MFPRHPTCRLACWLLVVLAIQRLAGLPLAAAFAVLPLCGRAALARWGRLVWRTRWLLLSLCLILGWGVAGEPLVADGSALIPTYEGLSLAATQLGRLLLVLAAVAALLQTTPFGSLMAGCHALMRPLHHLRLDVDRAVVRLSLALQYAEGMRGRDWRNLLDPDATAAAPDTVVLALPPLRLADWAWLAVAMGTLVWTVIA